MSGNAAAVRSVSEHAHRSAMEGRWQTNPPGRDAGQPLVSVIITVYNGASFVRAAIESVLAQTYPSVECIVIDDGSTDETPAILRSFAARIRSERQTNQGFARARNKGARLARGRFLSFLDHDDWWRPTKLERQLGRLAVRPDAAVIYTAIDVVDAEGEHIATIPAPPPELAFQNTLLLTWPHLALEQGALIRRDLFFELGGFDERLSTSIGCDLACRLASGYPVEPVDEPLAVYRQHSGQMHHDQSGLEHDMKIVYAKVLDRNPQYRPLVRHARYNLHVCLAHWCWSDKRRRHQALWHVAQAVRLRPGHVFGRIARRRAEPSVTFRLPANQR